MSARRGGTWFQRWRVPLGFLLAPIFVLLARPRPWTLAVGGVIGLVGLGLRAWASGHLRKNDALAITGPYAYTRNPLYLGSFLIGIGFTVAAGRWALATPVCRAFSWASMSPLCAFDPRRWKVCSDISIAGTLRRVSLFIRAAAPYLKRPVEV